MARPLPRTASNLWWNRRWPYRLFLLRELSAVFAAIYVVLLLILVGQVREGEAAFGDWLAVLRHPALWIVHLAALGFAQLHTTTWFRAVPKGLPLKIGGRRAPPQLLVAASYALWALASAVVLLLFLAG